MIDALDQAICIHKEAAFAFLEDLVSVPSVAGNENAALDVFVREAELIGLSVEKLPFQNKGDLGRGAGVAPVLEASGERYQVLARTAGNGRLDLLLNGHMDVVPADSDDAWATPPFKPSRREGRMYGRGTADMKSGFAVGMLALRALLEVEPDLFAAGSLGFLAAVEEECTGNGTLASIVHHDVIAPEVIVLEPTNLDIMLGGVGVLWLDIEVSTAAGHAHAAKSQGNAIDLGMQLVGKLRNWALELARAEPDPALPANIDPYAVNLGRICAGDWNSSAPAKANLGIRIGFPRKWTVCEAERRVKRVIDDFVAGQPAFVVAPRITSSGLRAAGYRQDPDSRLVRDLAAAHTQVHGRQPETFMMASTTDARTYINDFSVPAVCFGAVGHAMHGVDESVELDSIVDAARTLARFVMLRYSEKPSQ